ncbi:beta strand repeat-containing protein [Spirosoma oryzae]|nr:Ig-like domain-containing protein [Spirosoma oryzae]
MTSTDSYTGNAGRISTAQVTLLAPHRTGNAQFTITNLQGKVVGNQSMIWSQNARVNAPTENPSVDYISFGFSGSASPVLFDILANQEIELFSFKNTGGCLGTVTLFENQTDPFRTPNSQNTNPGNQMTILGRGPGNAYTGNYGAGATCTVDVPDLTASITGPSTLTAGTSGNYTIQVTNVGTASTSGISTVTTNLPNGLAYAGASGAGWGCSVGTPSGGTTPVSCTTTAVLSASASSSVNLSLTTSLTTAQTLTIAGAVNGGNESNTSNNAFSQTVSVQATPPAGTADVTATIAGPATLAPAAPGTLTLTVSNIGNSLYSGTTTTQTLVPAGLTYTGATGTGWTCGGVSQTGGTMVTCTSVQPIPAGSSLPPIYIAVSGGTSQTTTVQVPVSGTVTGGPNDNAANNTYGLSISVSGTPTVGIITPANNGTATTTLTVSGTATPGSQVTITGPGNNILCTTVASASGSYSCVVTVSSGPNTITAIACNGGVCSSPVTSSFTAITPVGPPSLTVAQPQPGSTVQPISGTATPGSAVVITGPGNMTLCATTASTSGTFTCSITVNPGVTSVTVTACNAGGCATQPVNVTAVGTPTVAIITPANNGTATTTPTVSGTATPGSQVTITGPGNNILCTTAANASGNYSCMVTLSPGPVSITAVASNAGGTSTPAVSSFTVVGPASLTVAQPQPGPTTQPISGTATPGSTVTITGPGNATLCTTTASASGTFSCNVTVSPGVTPVTVTACTSGGCATQSVSVTAVSPPTVGISSPANNGTATTSPTVSGTATPNSTVTLTGPNNTTLCTTTASASGAYSCNVTLPAGPASITAVASNAGGTSTPAVSSFTVVGPASLTVAQPQPGPTTQPISGTATPGSTVTITGPGNATLCTTTASTSGTFSCNVTVSPGVTPVTVTACTSGGCATQPVNVTAIATVPTSGTADLSTTISLSTKAPNQFDALTATIVVTNSGPNSATGVVDRITLPTGQPLTSLSTLAGTFNQTTGLWNIGTLAAGQSVTLTIGLSAATGGVSTIQSEIVASGQYDPDSTPNNQQYGEDDLAVACFSVPVDLCQGETFTFSISGSFTSIQWYRNGQPIAQATTTSLVINQEGTYTVSTNVNCPSGGCCPLIVRLRPAGSCCQPARCVPIVITKRTR